MPNIEMLTKLKAWLDDGAPHAYFDMGYDVVRFEDVDLYEPIGGQAIKEIDPECGTICCIAGAAVLMDMAGPGQLFPSLKDQAEYAEAAVGVWGVMSKAHDILGLKGTPGDRMEGDIYRHDLFDPSRAPYHCTPTQAARAVQCVIDGENPWPRRED